jgi:hypothetical protein
MAAEPRRVPWWRGVCAAAIALGLAGCSFGTTDAAGPTSPPANGLTIAPAAASTSAPSTSTVSRSTASASTEGAGTPASAPPPASALPSTLSRPVTVVEIGDSLGEDLGFGLADVLADNADVHLVQAAKGNSGLVQPQYYDWPRHLAQLLAQYQPAAVIVFLGANDVQDFYANGTLLQFGTPAWETAYRERVASLMQEATDAGSKVLWVGMPIMRSAVFSSSMQQLNNIYEQEAAVHPGVTFFSSWQVLSSPTGTYSATTTGPDGRRIVLRTPDGIHIAFGTGGRGADVLGQAVVNVLMPLLLQSAGATSATSATS